VQQSGESAVAVACTEPGAYEVVARVATADNCENKDQPHVAIPGNGTDRILCLRPAGAAAGSAPPSPAPSAS
jgi:hypothetical protein